ncbi:MAG: hypothetical protein KDK70_19485 [Myxococcales bacterium]|nr:hypothetical protein [Myxococcales bacterium]
MASPSLGADPRLSDSGGDGLEDGAEELTHLTLPDVADSDGDGYGDPDDCQPSSEPVDGSVDNGYDCNDADPDTFPGAAPNDDPRACMKDEDGDDWGDADPPRGVDPGTDCLDDAADVFPGAAYNETPPDLCAQDADGDGWGSDDPPAGADAGTDCLDDDPDVFPGAAEYEMPPDLCAQDADGDGWGDIDPPQGAEPGTDCDDANANAFPGAAQNEDMMMSTECMLDADGDGWGDANPGGMITSGSDCYDGNIDLNPGTLQLTVMLPYAGGVADARTIGTLAPVTGDLSPFVTLFDPMGATPNVDLITGTMNENGEIFANDRTSAQLQRVDYAGTCMMGTGTLTPVGMPYGVPGDIVCGLEFYSDGMLYGVDASDNLLTFDPATGQITGSTPVTLMGGGVLDISSCGMAFDCTEDRLLIANGIDETIYSVDPATGVATVLRDLDPFFPTNWLPTGLEYDPVTRNVFLSAGSSVYSVDLDMDVPLEFVNGYVEQLSNLQYLPICI